MMQAQKITAQDCKEIYDQVLREEGFQAEDLRKLKSYYYKLKAKVMSPDDPDFLEEPDETMADQRDEDRYWDGIREIVDKHAGGDRRDCLVPVWKLLGRAL